MGPYVANATLSAKSRNAPLPKGNKQVTNGRSIRRVAKSATPPPLKMTAT